MVYVALVGVTLILVRGTIFRSIQRRWPGLFRCSQCAGLWVGAAAGAAGIAPLGHGRLVDAALIGAATSCLSMGVDAVLLNLLGDPDEEKTT
jgi:hypothetical protein